MRYLTLLLTQHGYKTLAFFCHIYTEYEHGAKGTWLRSSSLFKAFPDKLHPSSAPILGWPHQPIIFAEIVPNLDQGTSKRKVLRSVMTNQAHKSITAIFLGLTLLLGVFVSQGQVASAHSVTPASPHQANVYTYWIIPDINIWGSGTYLRFTSVDGTSVAYFQDQSLGNNQYNIQWYIYQNSQLTDHQIVSWKNQLDEYIPLNDLEVRYQWINIPYSWAPNVYMHLGLWYPPDQVKV
jgi:hypothetical protein